ncbi:hypothetical protein A7D00_2062 [Trichophyton violaceum]|uniref:SWIM-type domain-containing protein n=1 Tax=Trichophyton violaceum TaxID=34388 RepID=A0A178FQW9_TRIVO|nr:hypothetical protein A7D00_2062 [Trichophyton violaceum]
MLGEASSSMSALHSGSPESSLPCSSVFITSLIGQLAACSRVLESLEGVSIIPDVDDDEGDTSRNPLSQLPADVLAKVKPLVLTLHCLFPNELLPALDILDRDLITRYTIKPRNSGPAGEATSRPEYGEDGGEVEVYCGDDPGTQRQQRRDINGEDDYEGECFDSEIYFVLSTAAKRRPGVEEDNHREQQESEYQVCLDAWNCTCPAFTLATFRDLDPEMDETLHQTEAHIELLVRNEPVDTTTKSKNWVFGGCLTQSTPCRSSPSGCCFMHDSPSICKHLLACALVSQCPGVFGSKVRRCEIDSREFAGKLAA